MRGLILGTAAYMSPEQAKGRSVDQRTDIFAFGCVLYEMLTGDQVFEGNDVTEILAAVVRAEPDWDRLPERTPAGVRALLRKCLRKDRAMRLQSAGDARIEIQEALSPSEPEPAAPRTGAELSRRTAVLSAAVALLLGGLIASVTVWKLKPPPARSVVRMAVPLPQNERLPALNNTVLALSPDGSRIAFISAHSSGQQIYVRSFDSSQPMAVPGTEGADSLTFSPDGKSLAFTKRGALMKVVIAGGAPLMICTALNVRGLSWGDNDTIVFADRFGTTGLSKVRAGGGMPQRFTTKGASVEGHRWPQVLPGGNAVLFTGWSRNLDDTKILVQRLDSTEPRELFRGGTYARYVPTGHLVYVRDGMLMAVRFDVSRLEPMGDPVQLAEGVLFTPEGAAQFDVSNDGSLIHVPGGLQGSGRQLAWLDRSGMEEPLKAPPHAYLDPRISPDGRQIAVTVQGANDDIWIYDIAHQTLTPLTFGARSVSPVWTADGARIIYRSSRNGFLNLFTKAADGSGGEERLTTSEENQTPSATSPDGQSLAFVTAGRDIWLLPLSGDKKARVYLSTPFTKTSPVFSPDSHWLAYASDESGKFEIYAQPFPDGGRRVQISRDGGTQPRWTSSNELFYRNGTRLMAVKMSTKPTLSPGEPQVLFETEYFGVRPNPASITFDVSSDGKRFLVLKEPEQASSVTQIDVVMNWIEELKRAVPTR